MFSLSLLKENIFSISLVAIASGFLIAEVSLAYKKAKNQTLGPSHPVVREPCGCNLLDISTECVRSFSLKKFWIRQLPPIAAGCLTLCYYFIKDKCQSRTVSKSAQEDKYWLPLIYMCTNLISTQLIEYHWENFIETLAQCNHHEEECPQWNIAQILIHESKADEKSARVWLTSLRYLKTLSCISLFTFSTSKNQSEKNVHDILVAATFILDVLQEAENLAAKDFRSRKYDGIRQNGPLDRRDIRPFWERFWSAFPNIIYEKWKITLLGALFFLLDKKLPQTAEFNKVVYFTETLTFVRTLN